MNGAADRLRQIRFILEGIDEQLTKANVKLATVDQAIGEVRKAREEIQMAIDEFRNAETLAGKENWRLMAQFDDVFIKEFLDQADENMLFLALKECNPKVLNIFRRVMDG